MRALLMSNSKVLGLSFLEYGFPYFEKFFTHKKKFLFFPFAAVTKSYDEFERMVSDVFVPLGHEVRSIHRFSDPLKAVADAEGFIVGGGNTFVLLSHFQKLGILDAVHKRVMNEDIPYIGWSAGANMACPTIKTTNDMPIQELSSFQALNLVPFQINPHYPVKELESHFGETRETRILEFLEVNPHRKVAALQEGLLFCVDGKSISLHGINDRFARIYEHGKEPRNLKPGDSFEFLMQS